MKDANEKIDRGQSMAEMWGGFADLCLPTVKPGSVQYEEMRKSFYSGALCLFNWCMMQMDEGEDVTEADLDRVSVMNAELHSFFEVATKQ